MANGAVILNNTRHGILAIKPHIRSHLVGGGGGDGGGGGEIWIEDLLYGGIDLGIGGAGSKSLRDGISTSDVRLGAGLRRYSCFLGGFFSITSITGIISNLANSSEPHALQLSTLSAEITSVPHIMHLYLYFVFSICADILFNFLDYTAVVDLTVGTEAEDAVAGEGVCATLFSSSLTT